MSIFQQQLSRRGLLRVGGGLAAAAAVGTSLVGCSSPGTTDDVLRIGCMLPITGPNALLGQSSWRGVELAAQMRNEAGGIAGKKLEIVFADVPDVRMAASESRRLVFSKNIKISLGTYGSSLSLAASEVFARTGYAYVELGGVSPAIVSRGYERVFRINPDSNKMAIKALEIMKDFVAPQLGKSPSELKVMVVHEDSNYGQSLATAAKKAAESLGMKIFATEAYSAKQTDVSSTVARIKAAKPDAVFAISYAADAVLLGRSMRDAGVKVPAWVGGGGGYSMQEFSNALGSAADGVLDADFPQPRMNTEQAPGLPEFLERYREKYGVDPDSGYPQVNFTGASLVFDVLESIGGIDDPDAFAQAMRQADFAAGQSVCGWGLQIGDDGQNTRSDHNVMQWRDGKLETVYPAKYAVRDAELITPFSR